jgi:tetratricopeptide (TPR) repeat protein
MACFQVLGDAFVSRLFDNDDAFVRLDLPLPELSSGAAWVTAAAAQAARRLGEGDRAADFMAKLNTQSRAAAKARQAGGRPSRVAEQERAWLPRRRAPTRGARGSHLAARLAAAQVTELSPAEADKEAGNAAVKRGEWEAAVRHYSDALARQPGLTAAANNRALALLRLGRFAEAEADCSTVGGRMRGIRLCFGDRARACTSTRGPLHPHAAPAGCAGAVCGARQREGAAAEGHGARGAGPAARGAG